MKTKKKITKKQIHAYVRIAVQIAFFIWMPAAFTSAFSGIKYIFTQIGNTSIVEINSFVKFLIGLCLYTIVFGRFFCGYACAFGSLGDWIHSIYLKVFKKLKKKPFLLNKSYKKYFSMVKYVVLSGIVILCFMGKYQNVTATGYSPWQVFSMLIAGNFHLKSFYLGIVLLIIIMVGMAICERFFCRFLCPMGAIFSMLPVIPAFRLKRDRENCLKGCKACTLSCPSDIELSDLADKNSEAHTGDCFMCHRCVNTCPKGNIKASGIIWNVSAIWFILVRVVILVIILAFLTKGK